MKIKRLTLDIDVKSWIMVERVIRELYLKGFWLVQVEQSPSKRGWHIIGWHNDGFLKKDLFVLRRRLGDDKVRLMLDMRKRGKKFIQVLFDEKVRK